MVVRARYRDVWLIAGSPGLCLYLLHLLFGWPCCDVECMLKAESILDVESIIKEDSILNLQS
jgi:hypothetical protein